MLLPECEADDNGTLLADMTDVPPPVTMDAIVVTVEAPTTGTIPGTMD